MNNLPCKLAALCFLLVMAPAAAAAQGGTIARGGYLATVGDCEICHTAPEAGAKPFAGGYPLHAIFGTVYSTNITPDRATGIGKWNPDDFYRAMHDGIAADGGHLYPAFPYPYFRKISRSDSDAIYAYLRTLAPVHQAPRPNHLIFPTDIRFLMTFWNGLFTPQSRFKPDPSRSPVWNRGGELVHGLGHCGGCHTPKNVFFSDKSGEALQGETIDNWHAPNLSGSLRTGLGEWSAADIAQYLKTGKNRFGWVVGNMRDVVRVSTSRWTDGDRNAVAVYLKSLPAAPEKQVGSPDAGVMKAGEDVYVARCAVCHESRNGDYPSLARNTLLNAPDATTVVRVILQGSQSPSIAGQPGSYSMPAFPVLGDKDLAAVATYIRNSWGNRAAPVSPKDVKTLRAAIRR